MGSLVACPCGHGVEDHTKGGCPGSPRERCACTRSPQRALDAAIASVRSTFVADREAERGPLRG